MPVLSRKPTRATTAVVRRGRACTGSVAPGPWNLPTSTDGGTSGQVQRAFLRNSPKLGAGGGSGGRGPVVQVRVPGGLRLRLGLPPMRAVPEHVVDGSVDAGLADRALLVPEVVELDGEQQVVALSRRSAASLLTVSHSRRRWWLARSRDVTGASSIEA